MKPKTANMKFSYMYRDGENFKEYGDIVFFNSTRLSPEAASERLRAQLIDGEYFYPKEWEVPLVCGEPWMDNWYEFVGLSGTEEKPTDDRTMEEFLETCRLRI